MLAALLLNLGSGPPPPSPPSRQGFGGGPFWSRYGYDRAYDAIRSNTSSAIEPVAEPPISGPVARPATPIPPKINYRVLSKRVADSVAKDMRNLADQRRQELEDENDEAEAILLMNLFIGD